MAAAAITAAIDDSHKLKTRFTFRSPTNDNILEILLGNKDLNQLTKKGVKFNHNSVGITCPTVCSSGLSQHGMFPFCSGYPINEESKLIAFLDRFRRSSSSTSDNVTCSSISYQGWRILRFRTRVGSGKRCYKRVQNAIYNWDFVAHDGKKSMGILAPKIPVHVARVEQAQHTTFPRRGLLGSFSEVPLFKSLYVVNPIHSIADIKDQNNKKSKSMVSSSSYATLDGHLLSGEERVSVILTENNAVHIEIVSFSRPAPSINGRIVWPFIGRMQKQFFLEEIKHLSRIANNCLI